MTIRALLGAIGCGAVGGMSPSLLELAGMARADDLPAGAYYLGMAIFAFLGGFIAAVYKEQLTHKAFFLGIGAPALIVAGGQATDNENLSYFPSVYAQDTAPTAPQSTAEADAMRVFVVPLQQHGGHSDLAAAKLKVTTPQGVQSVPLVDPQTIQAKLPKGINLSNSMVALIPKSGQSVYLEGVYSRGSRGDARRIRTDSVTIPEEGEILKLTFEEKKTFWSGFYEVMGMKERSKQLYEYLAAVEIIE